MKKGNDILKGGLWVLLGIIALGFSVTFESMSFLRLGGIILFCYGLYKIYIWLPVFLLSFSVIYGIVFYQPGTYNLLQLIMFLILFIYFLVIAILAQKKIIKF